MVLFIRCIKGEIQYYMFSKDLIQYVDTMFIRSAAKIFWIFPIEKNKIIFTSFIGKQRSCNPLYIQKYLDENYHKKFKFIWDLRNISNESDKKCIVKFFSIRHFYHFCTSKVIIDNGGMPTYMPKRKGQYVINTWHGGGAYKDSSNSNISNYRLKLEEYKSKNTDLVLSSSRIFSEKVIPDIVLGRKYEIMPSGLPRNDVFFNTKIACIREKVCKQFNISEDKLIILFAPTFRSNSTRYEFCEVLDWTSIFEKITQRFDKEPVVIFRAHNFMLQYDVGGAIDATSYPDMQELLCAADILISDYSSTIWDFSLTKKPCFLYCPDLDYYLNEDRGVYTPIETWPGILCRTNEELEQAILNFDEAEYVKKVEKHHADLGSYENGTACEQVCKRIAEVCGIEEES